MNSKKRFTVIYDDRTHWEKKHHVDASSPKDAINALETMNWPYESEGLIQILEPCPIESESPFEGEFDTEVYVIEEEAPYTAHRFGVRYDDIDDE